MGKGKQQKKGGKGEGNEYKRENQKEKGQFLKKIKMIEIVAENCLNLEKRQFRVWITLKHSFLQKKDEEFITKFSSTFPRKI